MFTPRILKLIFSLGISLILIVLGVFYIYKHYARENFSYSIKHIPQNAFNWVNPQLLNTNLLTATEQKQYAEKYIAHYFSPWSPNYLNFFPMLTTPVTNLQQFKQLVIKNGIDPIIKNPGYGINRLPNSLAWVESIVQTMDMEHFLNANIKAITITTTNIRNLPTKQPSFGNWDQAGEGYPFDLLQETTLVANTPVIIVHKTRDGSWSLIITNNTYGWVPTSSLAVVDEQFIQQWQSGSYLVLINNAVPIADNEGIYRFTADIGKIFPRPAKNNAEQHSKSILIAAADANQRAVIKIGQLDDHSASAWPLPVTQNNLATIMNRMLGVKYGWGGMSGDCDCSFTTMDLFSTFGIWLPRDSSDQPLAGKQVVDLQNLSNKDKQTVIISKGIPFFTLLHIPGHITVYLGAKNHRVYIFQTVWGVHTRNLLGKEGRAILGATVITPADLGINDLNVTTTWLREMDQMVLFK